MNGTQSKMARAALGWSTHDLANAAGVGRATVVRFEDGGTVSAETRDKLESALVGAGVQFTRRADRLGVTITPSGCGRPPSVPQMIAAAKRLPDGPANGERLRGPQQLRETKAALREAAMLAKWMQTPAGKASNKVIGSKPGKASSVRPPTRLGAFVSIRLQPEMLAEVDTFAAEKGGLSRPEAIRRLISRGAGQSSALMRSS